MIIIIMDGFKHISGSGVDFWLKNGAVGGSLATSLKGQKVDLLNYMKIIPKSLKLHRLE